MNKKLKRKIDNQLDVIANWNSKIADFYTKPKRISDIRTIIFNEIAKLREIIKL